MYPQVSSGVAAGPWEETASNALASTSPDNDISQTNIPSTHYSPRAISRMLRHETLAPSLKTTLN